jgi:hypothetical protein
MQDIQVVSVTIRGEVVKVGEVETKTNGLTNKSFSKRELRLLFNQDSKFPQLFSVEFGGKNMDRINMVQVGDMVEIQADLRSREWQDKVFLNLSGWKCVIEAGQPTGSQYEEDQEDIPSLVSADDNEFQDEDNLPF